MEIINLKSIFRGIFLLISINSILSCGSKKGCTDPNSLSYASDAKIDDESCVYPNYALRPTAIQILKSKFKETSALSYSLGKIWTIVDEEENILYSIDTKDGGSEHEVELSDIKNVNFEALAESDEFIFVGDIGNNDGKRTDLAIFRIRKNQIDTAQQESTVLPESISFIFEDQNNFDKNKSTDYDAEALLYLNNYLYIFTKNNSDEQTKLYEIPAIPGKQVAKLKGIFNVSGLITDADITDDGNKIVLVGHDKQKTKCFLWILKDFPGNQIFNGKKTRVELGPYSNLGQMEGVSFFNADSIFISNEQDGQILSKLYGLNIGGVK